MDADLDVVVVGGGIQGLLALEALQTHGYSCALVTDGALGGGQTLHSHGFLNTGFGMLGDELPGASHDIVQPYLRARGVEPTGEWRAVLPPGFPGQAAPAPLPAGFDPTLGAAAVALADRNFPKRALVAAIASGLRDHVVQGRATVGAQAGNVHPVRVATAGGEDMTLHARVVVVAAGCGSKRVLQALVGSTAQTEQIQHRRVHMICVRGPRTSLPAISVMAMPLGLMLAAHEDAGVVTWYVTPMEFGGPGYDDAPNDAASVQDTAMLTRGFTSLLQLYPALPDADGVLVGSYAGYRQDVGEQPSIRMCEPVSGADRIIVALPSGLVGPWINVTRVVELVAERVVPVRGRAHLTFADTSVGIGMPVEDRDGFAWHSVDDFGQRLSDRRPASNTA